MTKRQAEALLARIEREHQRGETPYRALALNYNTETKHYSVLLVRGFGAVVGIVASVEEWERGTWTRNTA